ncbi:GntR family transcriptional regulator [Oryzifoliimicrobium ureilyticus]|uniref:GntR family transcriptional regulator n=1 Tax=Oryzifoliimicrobium ureilyticus TaxID=3113724 RepID=UPI0030767BF2
MNDREAILSPYGEGDGGTQHIREAIRTAIVERRLSPGTKLSESDVGSLFNVSRTLARAALQALSYEGLVRVERNRGAFVAYPSPEEARQIFAARQLVEPGILRQAAGNITSDDISRLKQLLADEGKLMNERGQTARRAEIKASGDFHLEISALSQNLVLHRFMEELIARSSLVIALYGRSTASSCGHNEHEHILECLAKNNIDAACQTMLHHIEHIEADLDLRERRGVSLKEAFEL